MTAPLCTVMLVPFNHPTVTSRNGWRTPNSGGVVDGVAFTERTGLLIHYRTDIDLHNFMS